MLFSHGTYDDFKKLSGLINALNEDSEIEINPIRQQEQAITVISSKDNIWNYVHSIIINVAKKKFIDGHYADAVESAFKEINSRLKEIYRQERKEEKDGADLMRKAFTPNDPLLIFEDMNCQNGKDTQQGYMDIFAGAMTGIRNPKAHENLYITENDAAKKLIFASLLMDKIDQAVKFSKIKEPKKTQIKN